MTHRCAWVSNDPIYIQYHDEEWGRPIYDDRLLFEFLCLEGAQAGLSWITVLKKREHYRKLFMGFDPKKMAALTDDELETFLLDPGIIRNRRKVYGFRQNAQAFLALTQQGSFADFLWGFVGGKPVINKWRQLSEIPTHTENSDLMAKSLKKAGFTFVGTTICYAFMQAVGMVNDHEVDCSCYTLCAK